MSDLSRLTPVSDLFRLTPVSDLSRLTPVSDLSRLTPVNDLSRLTSGSDSARPERAGPGSVAVTAAAPDCPPPAGQCSGQEWTSGRPYDS